MAVSKSQPMRPAEIDLVDAVNGLQETQEDYAQDIADAKSAAENAANAASTAQETATSAANAASTAQETATSAAGAASTAQETATNAAGAASTAQSTADGKQDAFTVSEPITLANNVLGVNVPIRKGSAPTTDTNGIQTATIIGGIHEDGHENRATDIFAIAMGEDTLATGIASVAEGYLSEASGDYSHAEGNQTIASGKYSHSEGSRSSATSNYSHAENRSKAKGQYSHAENEATATGQYSHAEGSGKSNENYSHAEGTSTANDYEGHAEGAYTICSLSNGGGQHTGGRYNIAIAYDSTSEEQTDYLEIIGNGTSNTARSNARTLDGDGKAWFAGDVTCDATQGNHENLYSLRAIGAIVASTPSFEHGTSNSVAVSAGSHTVVDITFGSAKTEIPVVFPAIQCPTAGVNLIATVQSVSNSQCAICVTNLGTTDVSDVTVDYLAVYGR